MLKGTAAVVIAGYFGGPNAAMLAALGAFSVTCFRCG
jgi:glycerol-3-phosphate acyltransferase PlsY